MKASTPSSGISGMHKRLNLLSLLFLVILPLTNLGVQTTAALAATQTSQPGKSSNAVAGSTVPIIIKFKSSATATDVSTAIHAASPAAQIAHDLSQIHSRVLNVPANAAPAIIAAFTKQTVVQHAGPAIKLSKASEPNDPGYSQQWALPKIGWDQAYGAVSISGSAKIAVLDTGVDASHPDLSANIVAGQSEIGGDPNTDPNGHGTELAGIAAASVNNSVGMAGVAYAGASISSVQVLGSDGTGYDSDVVAGVLWAADNGANVILMGFSSPTYSAALADAVSYAESKGVVVVAATGNAGSTSASYPAGMPGVIGVASTDQSDNLSSSSNTGSASVAAPGEGIYATQVGGATAVSVAPHRPQLK